jgi:SH3 domain protein
MSPDRQLILCLTVLLFPLLTAAETAFITNEIRVGLHTEKTIDSPIIKILSSGAALEIIKREENLSYVQEPGGISGWVDNSYLKSEQPLSNEARKLQEQIRSLEQQLAAGKKNQQRDNDRTGAGDESAALSTAYTQLKQQYNAERVKTGELQVQLAELGKQTGQNSDNESLYQKITQLQEDNRNLEIQLASALHSSADSGISKAIQFATDGTTGTRWRRQLIYLCIALLAGLILGMYIMDYLNRRRHGGFRI